MQVEYVVLCSIQGQWSKLCVDAFSKYRTLGVSAEIERAIWHQVSVVKANEPESKVCRFSSPIREGHDLPPCWLIESILIVHRNNENI